jgi:transitional endoplasmic reticulum ATPase
MSTATIGGATRPAPAWFTAYSQSYQAGEAHAFLLHGDVEGTAFEDISTKNLLLVNLAARRAVVAIYHLAGGITLYDEASAIPVSEDDPAVPGQQRPTRRERALAICGLDKPAAKSATPSAGALAQLTGGIAPPAAANDPFAQATSPGDALPLLQMLLTQGRRVAVVIDYADSIAPASAMAGKGAMSPGDRRVLVTLLAWAKDPQIAGHGNPIFLLARDGADLHPDLRASGSGWKTIAIPLPDRAQRREYIAWYLAKRAEDDGSEAIALDDGLAVDELANLTAGLSLRNIEDILLVAAQEGGLTRRILRQYKDAIVTSQYSEVAEMIDPLVGGFADLGGLDQVKQWFTRRVIAPLRAGRFADAPKNVLLVGPPGTGKTFLVRGLAQETGFSAVAMNSSKILGGIVGESERNLAKFFEFATSLAPVIVFVDEIDQSDMAQRGNNSGNPVAKNLFNGLMQFMSDETVRGKVVIVLASNRPDLLDSALIRDGRVDAIIPVLLPERDERRAIAARQAAMQGVAIDDAALDLLADRTESYSAAGIGALVRDARMEAEGGAVDAEIVACSLDAMRPSGVDEAEYYTMLAVGAVRDKRLLPPRYAALVDQRQAIAAAIEQRQPVIGGASRRARRDEF